MYLPQTFAHCFGLQLVGRGRIRTPAISILPTDPSVYQVAKIVAAPPGPWLTPPQT